ncbi:MAG: exosortase-associated protein EpsI, B-type [Aquabacterium sp.]
MNTLTARLPDFSRQAAILVAMVLAALLALALKPKVQSGNSVNQFDLQALVPETFGEWKVDRSIFVPPVSPDVQAEIDKIYNQVLSRTYVNRQGQRIMLSIAYGADQSDSLSVHLPEGCYRGQGFEIKWKKESDIQAGGQTIPAVKLLAVNRQRVEPITYWIMVGDRFARNRTERKLMQLRSSLTGTVPDGMLVRVSSLGRDLDNQFAIQQNFMDAMLSGVSPDSRRRLSGLPA